MSVVTDIIVLCSCGESQADNEIAPPPIAAINVWLDAERYGVLKDITEHAGGYKYMQCEAFAGAFNYLRLREFFDTARAQAWQEPDSVRILVQEENDLHFSFYDLERKLA